MQVVGQIPTCGPWPRYPDPCNSDGTCSSMKRNTCLCCLSLKCPVPATLYKIPTMEKYRKSTGKVQKAIRKQIQEKYMRNTGNRCFLLFFLYFSCTSCISSVFFLYLFPNGFLYFSCTFPVFFHCGDFIECSWHRAFQA